MPISSAEYGAAEPLEPVALVELDVVVEKHDIGVWIGGLDPSVVPSHVTCVLGKPHDSHPAAVRKFVPRLIGRSIVHDDDFAVG